MDVGPFAYCPWRATLESMDLSLEPAAEDVYAAPWNTFRRVTFPLLWSGITAGFRLALVISHDDLPITEFANPAGQDKLPTYMPDQLRRKMTPEVNVISTAFFPLVRCDRDAVPLPQQVEELESEKQRESKK